MKVKNVERDEETWMLLSGGADAAYGRCRNHHRGQIVEIAGLLEEGDLALLSRSNIRVRYGDLPGEEEKEARWARVTTGTPVVMTLECARPDTELATRGALVKYLNPKLWSGIRKTTVTLDAELSLREDGWLIIKLPGLANDAP